MFIPSWLLKPVCLSLLGDYPLLLLPLLITDLREAESIQLKSSKPLLNMRVSLTTLNLP